MRHTTDRRNTDPQRMQAIKTDCDIAEAVLANKAEDVSEGAGPRRADPHQERQSLRFMRSPSDCRTAATLRVGEAVFADRPTPTDQAARAWTSFRTRSVLRKMASV